VSKCVECGEEEARKGSEYCLDCAMEIYHREAEAIVYQHECSAMTRDEVRDAIRSLKAELGIKE
jgi:hypothetical protein